MNIPRNCPRCNHPLVTTDLHGNIAWRCYPCHLIYSYAGSPTLQTFQTDPQERML